MTFQRKPVTLVLTLDEATVLRDALFAAIALETDTGKLSILHKQYSMVSEKIHKVIQARDQGVIRFDPTGNSGSR